jgi:hypothetical protein
MSHDAGYKCIFHEPLEMAKFLEIGGFRLDGRQTSTQSDLFALLALDPLN